MSDVDNPFPGEDEAEESVAATVAEKPAPKKAAKKEPPPDKDRYAITKYYRRKDGPYSEGKYGIKIVHLWTDAKTGAHYRVNIYLTVNSGKPVATDHLVESDFFVCRDGNGKDKDGKPNRVIHSINGAVQTACNEPTAAPM